MCSSHACGHISDERHAAHIKRKTEAQNEKLHEKRLATDNSVVITLNLQVVLLAPRLFANVSYFKTKLACHDVTLYSLGTKTAPCYLWHGGQGDVTTTSNNFASCILDYLVTVANNSPTLL